MDAASTEIISPVRGVLNILSVLVFALFSDEVMQILLVTGVGKGYFNDGHRCG